MSDQAITPFDGDQKLATLLKSPVYFNRFKEVLGDRAPQFVSSVISIGNSMPDVEPKSIIGSAMVAACLDLPIDKNLGFAWIVPYSKSMQVNGEWKKVKLAQFQMGSKGYVQLAMRSSQYARMNSLAINREVFLGYDDVGEPQLDFDQYDPAKEVWGYFFGFKLVNGYLKKVVWTRERVIEHAKKYSQAYRSGADIWKEHFDGMADKTVVANTLRKWGPLSIQLQRALVSDQAIMVDVDAEPLLPEIGDQVDRPQTDHPEKVKQDQQQAAGNTSTAAAKPKKTEKPEPKAPPAAETKAAPAETKPPVTEPKQAAAETKAPPAETKQQQAATPAAPEDPAAALQKLVAKKKEQPAAPAEQPAAATAPAEDEKELADLGLAPKPKEPENVVQMPTGPQLSASQAKLKDLVEGAGYTFEQFIRWAKSAVQMQKAPASWEGMEESTAAYFAKTWAGLKKHIDKFFEKEKKA